MAKKIGFEARTEKPGHYPQRGFKMTFENGFSISVQWGSGTYSENHNAIGDEISEFKEVSRTAEVALIFPSGRKDKDEDLQVVGSW